MINNNNNITKSYMIKYIQLAIIQAFIALCALRDKILENGGHSEFSSKD
jgi:hypothetical protein